jgi:hypothetical protein
VFVRKTLVCLSLLAPFTDAIASTWGQPVTISGYFVYADGAAYITTSNNQNPEGCTSTQYLYLDTSQPFFKELYASIMLAQTTGSTVSLRYHGCAGIYPKIMAVAVPAVW